MRAFRLHSSQIALLTACLCAGAVAATPGAVEPCLECHTENGFSGDSLIPTLAGQSAFVLVDWMFIFADRARPCEAKHPAGVDPDEGPEDHCQVFAAMEESEMEASADYFAGLPFVSAEQTTDPALASLGKQIHDVACEKCHTDGGSNADDDAGILAGQWLDYLIKAMDDYASGDREMPEKMIPKFEPLDEGQRKALAHYYASQGAQ